MMKERIMQIMHKENMTQQDFAKAIEVSPASLSNIFNGKTNPTNNHVNAIHRRFPNISINWLMFGEGDMYTTVSDETKQQEGLFSATGSDEREEVISQTGGVRMEERTESVMSPKTQECSDASGDDQMLGKPVTVVREVVKYVDKPQRKITEIRIFFDDGTFEVFS